MTYVAGMAEHNLATLLPGEYQAREQIKTALESYGVTLDGQPAGIFGLRLKFGVVRSLKTPGLSAEFAWPTLNLLAREGLAQLSSY